MSPFAGMLGRTGIKVNGTPQRQKAIGALRIRIGAYASEALTRAASALARPEEYNSVHR